MWLSNLVANSVDITVLLIGFRLVVLCIRYTTIYNRTNKYQTTGRQKLINQNMNHQIIMNYTNVQKLSYSLSTISTSQTFFALTGLVKHPNKLERLVNGLHEGWWDHNVHIDHNCLFVVLSLVCDFLFEKRATEDRDKISVLKEGFRNPKKKAVVFSFTLRFSLRTISSERNGFKKPPPPPHCDDHCMKIAESMPCYKRKRAKTSKDQVYEARTVQSQH